MEPPVQLRGSRARGHPDAEQRVAPVARLADEHLGHGLVDEHGRVAHRRGGARVGRQHHAVLEQAPGGVRWEECGSYGQAPVIRPINYSDEKRCKQIEDIVLERGHVILLVFLNVFSVQIPEPFQKFSVVLHFSAGTGDMDPS